MEKMGTNGVDSEKFHQQLVHIFPKSTVFSADQKLCGRQKSPAVFIPPLVQANSVDEIDVKDVKMTTCVDEKGGVTRHYQISWVDVIKGDNGDNNDGGDGEEKPMDLKKTSSAAKIQEGLKTGKIQCDGPCGQSVDLGDVAQFGCDHVICDKCRRSQKSTALFDGSPGCCHPDCVEKATTDGQKLRSGRRLDSVASSVSMRSNDGPWEMLNVHICVIKKWGGNVYRSLVEYEYPSQTRIADMTKSLDEYMEPILHGRSYFCWHKPENFKDLEPISLLDTNLRFYHLAGYKPLIDVKLFILIVVDGVGLE